MIEYNPKKAYNLIHDGVLAFARAEQAGMRIDTDYCIKQSTRLLRRINRLVDKIKETKFYRHWEHATNGKPNMNSNQQLANFLYKTKKIPPAKTTVTGQGATDEEALIALNIPELNDILRVRKLKKLKDTYLEGFLREQVNGFLHPFFNLHTVKTYRSSSDRPNFQNIPKRDKEAMEICRRAIFPRKGHQLLEVDFSGIEVRIAACYHQDPTMMTYIKDPTTDMHRDMAMQLFKLKAFDKKIAGHVHLRQAAKNGFVFPQFYGDYYKNCAVSLACGWGALPAGNWKPKQGVLINEGVHLSDHLISQGIKNMNAFIEHVKGIEYDFWYNRFPMYRKWKEKCWKKYQETASVEMFTGFQCYELMGRNDALNRAIQGTAFHCLLWCFIRLDAIMRKEKWKSRLIGQIHDAILFDIAPGELEHVARTVRLVTTGDLVRNLDWISVPLEVEADLAGVDESWADLKPYKLP